MDDSGANGMLPGMIGLVLTIVQIIAMWKVYVKAGKPGWAAIIPFYNLYILLKIAGKPGWWLILYIIPIVNIIIHAIVSIGVAKAFNRSSLFGIVALWLFSFVGYLILGFGKSTYSNAPASATTPPTPSTSTPPGQTP
jgi:hypothetical protein